MTRTKAIVGPTLLALLLAGCMGAPTSPEPTGIPDAASVSIASIGIADWTAADREHRHVRHRG